MSKPISIYDGRTRKRLAYLQNAYAISFEQSTNSLWTAQFSLPYSDPKTKYCKSFNLVELWDEDGGGKDRYVGLFRIMPSTEETIGTEANIVYRLEHVLSTLLDDVMLGYHEVGNLEVFTRHSIGYILDNQTEKKWALKQCDYEHQFLYGWQDENLLSALFSIVQPFSETDYYWEFDTTEFPWQLSLRKANPNPVSDIRYRKNLNGLTRIVDPTNLTTRLYCYGYGQGDNKLTISDVNNGAPYLESPNIGKYGVITQVWTDERFTIAESLLSVGKTMLKRLEEPSVSYEIDLQTMYSASNLRIGDTVRMISLGLDEPMTVKKISKDDVSGAPQSGKIILGEGTIDISNSVAELAERQRIAETYSQGAESIFTDSFVDNADADIPAEVIFTIPENVVHVNEIRFSCLLTNFRAYSKAIQGGGMGEKTTEAGGADTLTSRSGGGQVISSHDGGGGVRSSLDGGNKTISALSGGGDSKTSGGGGYYPTTVSIKSRLSDGSGVGLHSHGIGTSNIVTWVTAVKNSQGVVTGVSNSVREFIPSGDHTHEIVVPSHTHSVPIPDHTHSVPLPSHRHDINLPDHTHGINLPTHDHKIDIPAHNHEFVLPNHTHGIDYGIYKGPKASKMSVYLDDELIGEYDSSIKDLNLIDYMSKNANGNIMRGQHSIRIIPDSLTRVECTFQIRLFTNMHGGKQY